MYYALPETHRLLQDSVRQFAQTHIAPIAAEIDKTNAFPNHL